MKRTLTLATLVLALVAPVLTAPAPQQIRCLISHWEYGYGYAMSVDAATDNAWQDAALKCGNQGDGPGNWQVIEVTNFGNGIYRVQIKMCCIPPGD